MDPSSVRAGVVVCFAVPPEARPFRSVAPAHARVFVTGMGAQCARAAMARILAPASGPPPRMILTCGFAGGLDPSLKTGDVLYQAEAGFPLTAQLSQSGAKPGRFHCADRVATRALEKRALRDRTGADAVEMESGVISDLAKARGIPCATVRVISDPADEDLPMDFNQVTGPDGALSPTRLTAYLAIRPWLIPRLIRLGQHTSRAARTLAEVLARALAA